ncbi:hypothetical protein POSPLADRAFT_1149540 [Postia placenta MAD-698-R-SB12]|uniref:C2H2-type domain-containing protein n=1 Tax=Postia placenta MAD-698-R-SB12 TaxID=670580 RepID=A0A1X6MUQ1_9APHY|nr:hypothetical protein POSPLADRAFT_1149540 [Postia placenta MAD-698-R-SB12]OSX60059.1 hypothetical protein POSPLADRAFT_1149540 [Postia placenta MAD-698-R-SB12]
MSSTNVQCCWGHTPCNVSLDDISAAGINKHLKTYHFANWHPRDRATCQWQTDDGTCASEMYCGNLGKHVAAVHLLVMQRECPYCGEVFARSDALSRHIHSYCSAAGNAAPAG